MLTPRHLKRAGALRNSLAAWTFVSLAAVGFAQEDNQNPGGPPDQAAATAAVDADTTTATTGARVAGVVASNTPIERVLSQISDQAQVTVVARGKVSQQKVSLIQPKKIPVRDLLNQLVNSQPNWLLYEPADRPGTYEIWDQETYRTEVLPRLVRPKVFTPQEITAEEAAKAIDGIKTPNIGTVAFDPRSNKVFMTDLVPVLELAQRLIEQIDVKFLTRVYYIEHADVNTVQEKLAALKSPAAPDLQVDERTRQIIVQDRLDVLQKMEQLVETLDKGPEMRVYDINNFGIEGEELEDLEEALTEILTTDAYIKFNIRQSKLIIRDLPEVHERVEKILAAFDAPVKQVLIQAEVIETEFSDGFNWSLDYAVSGDILGAALDGLVTGIPTGATPGTGTDATPDPDSVGFINFRKEFPVFQGGSTGINAQYLSRHAYVKLAAAMSDSRTRVLQQPRIFVQNQESAVIEIGQRVPFYTGGSSYVNNNNNNNVGNYNAPQLQFLNVGLFMEIIPIISNNGLIEMEITLENSSATFTDITFAGETYTAPATNDQSIETVLWIPNGETRVIGGLLADSKSETRSGVPGLMKIPVLGSLFGSYNRPAGSNRRRNLMVFLTPTIVEESPSDYTKYKGRKIVNEDMTTPTATLTDLPTGSFERPGTQLEKLGGYEPPPFPDLESMSRFQPTDSGPILLSPEDVPSLQATVETEAALPPSDIYGDDTVSELRRITIEDKISTDSITSLLPPRAAGPSGLLSTGSRNLMQPPSTPAGAPAQPGQAAAAAQPAQSAGQPVQAARPPVAPPPTETRSR